MLNKVDSVLVLDNTNYFSTSILLKQSMKFVLCVGFLLLQNVKRIIYSIKRFKLILILQLKLSFEKLMLNTTKTPIADPNINIQHRYDFPFLILPVRKKQYLIISRPTTIPSQPTKVVWKITIELDILHEDNIYIWFKHNA